MPYTDTDHALLTRAVPGPHTSRACADRRSGQVLRHIHISQNAGIFRVQFEHRVVRQQ